MDVSYPELKRAGSFNNRTGITEQVECGPEALAIEDLLDFTNEDICGSIESSDGSQDDDGPPVSSIIDVPACDEPKQSSVLSVAAVSTEKAIKQSQTSSVFNADIAGSDELCIPCDDVAELEWLSNFVEESFSSGDGAVLTGGLDFLPDEKAFSRCSENKQRQETASPVSVLDRCRTGTRFSTNTTTTSSNSTGHGGLSTLGPNLLYLSRPGRARSKRCRTAVCFWNTRILSITDDCKILEDSSTSKLTSQPLQSSSSSESEDAGFALGYDDSEDFFLHRPSKKVSCGSKSPYKGGGGTKATGSALAKQPAVDGRRCLHCGSQKTPQWRAGPMGPKTLCNACGVRYKSGRLLPEYRPAASPTFVESVHSNSHRRVLEMRRQRAEAMCGSSQVDQQLGVC